MFCLLTYGFTIFLKIRDDWSSNSRQPNYDFKMNFSETYCQAFSFNKNCQIGQY